MLDMRSAGSLMPARTFVTVAAIAHLVIAAVLLFVPATLGLAALPARAVAAVYAAAVLGLRVAAWVARAVSLGGIYGRALVSGQFAHGLAGALALVRPAATEGGAWWAALAAYAGLALGWGWLLLRGAGSSAATSRGQAADVARSRRPGP